VNLLSAHTVSCRTLQSRTVAKTSDDADSDTDELLSRLATESDPSQVEIIYERLVERHLDLVNAIANRYRRRGVEWDDLVQVGRLALCKAITGYRTGRGPSFRAYAVPTITGEIKRYFRDHVWDVRPPRRLQELQLDLRECEGHLGQQLGHSPSDRELAAALGIDESALRDAQVAGRVSTTISIDAPTESGSGTTWSDHLATQEKSYDLVEARVLLRPAVEVLSPRERRIIYLRFVCGWTQQEIGQTLGVSQMQVSRLLSRILGKLRAQVVPRARAS
jgi:RNA polymerase sigma-B factor